MKDKKLLLNLVNKLGLLISEMDQALENIGKIREEVNEKMSEIEIIYDEIKEEK